MQRHHNSVTIIHTRHRKYNNIVVHYTQFYKYNQRLPHKSAMLLYAFGRADKTCTRMLARRLIGGGSAQEDLSHTGVILPAPFASFFRVKLCARRHIDYNKVTRSRYGAMVSRRSLNMCLNFSSF